MERNFTNENVEEFLRRSTDELRMRPSAKVWKGISSKLKWRRRGFGFILGTSLLLTTALGYYLLNESSDKFISPEQTTPVNKESLAIKLPAPGSNQTAVVNTLADNKEKTSTVAERSATVLNKETESFLFTEPANEFNATVNLFTPSIVDDYFENDSKPENKSISMEEVTTTDPLSIESVQNLYQPVPGKKLQWQMHFTPTVSYRKLNDAYIENVATHKPAFGFQMGFSAKYPVAKNVKLRGGLQFNVNRYEIKTNEAYAQMATIRLNEGNRVNYVSTVTNYNNFSGGPVWLENFYFQVSAPVGVELKIKGDDKMHFGVASTIQPTYLLGDKAYLISSDYKNYAEMQGLVRRWNVNTSVETFVGYSTGRLNWQVGPQVRYQILSSYLQKYPVKENLFDFGLKVGLSVNKQ